MHISIRKYFSDWNELADANMFWFRHNSIEMFIFKFSTNLSLPSQTDHWFAGVSDTQRGWSSFKIQNWNPPSCCWLAAEMALRPAGLAQPEFHVHRAQRHLIARVTETKKKIKHERQSLTIDAVTALCCMSQTLTEAKRSQLGWSSWQQTRQTSATDVKPKTKLQRPRTAAFKAAGFKTTHLRQLQVRFCSLSNPVQLFTKYKYRINMLFMQAYT